MSVIWFAKYLRVSFILGQYVDLDYSIWLYRLLTPLMLTFVLPTLFVLLIYLSISFLYVYKLHRLVSSFNRYILSENVWNQRNKTLHLLQMSIEMHALFQLECNVMQKQELTESPRCSEQLC